MALNKGTNGEETSHLNPILILKHSFHTFSITLLSLLLPLSFLLLSKLPSPSLLHLLVSSLTLSSLLQSLTNHLPKPRLSVAWAFVCTFQACISLNIETTISAGIKSFAPNEVAHVTWVERVERVAFLMGVYETMLHWMKVFVKPVVDNTVYGEAEVEEGRAQRPLIGAAFGGLWLWMLRDEVEPLVTVAGGGGLYFLEGWKGWDRFALWTVSYSTVVIGMVRVVEMVFMVGTYFSLFCLRGKGDVAAANPDSRSDEVILALVEN